METTSRSQPVIVERSYSAPVEKVWRALTDNEQMKQWFFKLPEFKAEPGFEFEFEAGKDEKKFMHKCVVKEVIPNQRLSYSWRYEGYEGDSLVSFDLSDDNGGTHVKITHTGLDTFPNVEDFAPKNFNTGWSYFLNDALAGFLEKE